MDAIIAEHSRPDGSARWRPERCQPVALVLHAAEIEPDWVTGVSIGTINSAIIAGNSRKHRLPALRTFWKRITERKASLSVPEQRAGLVVHDIHREHEFR